MPSNPNSKTDPTCEWLLTLPDQIDAAAERGQPVVLRLEREPDAGVRRLMATLGVPVEVQPVNHDVRVAEGADGGIVVMSAWCATCKLDSTPNPRGECVFCGTVIVDEDRLSAREMREQIAGRGRSEVQRRTKAPSRVRPVEAPQPPGLTRRVNGSGTDGGPRGDTSAVADVDGPTTRRGYWTRERIIEAIQTWAAEHDGHPPLTADWKAGAAAGCPTTNQVQYAFNGSWSDAVEAAGFPRPVRGTRPPGHDKVPPAVREAEANWHVAVKGTGLRYRSSMEAYAAAEEVEADGERVADQSRFDGNEAKAEQALDASRELANVIRLAARVAERREGNEPAADAAHTTNVHSNPPAGLSEPDVVKGQSSVPHATTPIPVSTADETSGPLNPVDPEPEPEPEPEQASVNQQMRLRYLELLIAKAEEQPSPDDALLDRIERFMEIA